MDGNAGHYMPDERLGLFKFIAVLLVICNLFFCFFGSKFVTIKSCSYNLHSARIKFP